MKMSVGAARPPRRSFPLVAAFSLAYLYGFMAFNLGWSSIGAWTAVGCSWPNHLSTALSRDALIVEIKKYSLWPVR
jgi:hypothetical protein